MASSVRRDRAARVAERQRAYFNRALHELLVLPDGAGGWHDAPALDAWRARDRQKTVAAALVRPLPLSLSLEFPPPLLSPLVSSPLSTLPHISSFFLCVAACQRPPLHTSHTLINTRSLHRCSASMWAWTRRTWSSRSRALGWSAGSTRPRCPRKRPSRPSARLCRLSTNVSAAFHHYLLFEPPPR